MSSCEWVVATPPRWASLRFERPGITGAMGPSMSWDPWPHPVVRAAVGGGRRSVHRLAKTAPSEPFWAFVYTVATRVAMRVATRAASSDTSASTTMVYWRPPGGHLSLSRETRLCASGAIVGLASSRDVNPQTPERPENSLVPPNKTVRLTGKMSRT